MKSLMKLLKEWWHRVAMAMWFHPEFDASKRLIIAGAAALVAVSLVPLPQLPEFSRGVINAAQIRAELAEVTRRAFMPRVYVQLWKSAPLMAELLKAA